MPPSSSTPPAPPAPSHYLPDIPQPVRHSPVTCFSLPAEQPADIPQQPVRRCPVACYSLPNLRVRLPGRTGAGEGAPDLPAAAVHSPLVAALKGRIVTDAAAIARFLHRPVQRRTSVRFLVNGRVLGDSTAGEPQPEPEPAASGPPAKKEEGTMAGLWQPSSAGAPVIAKKT